jgi:hypothetical protein
VFSGSAARVIKTKLAHRIKTNNPLLANQFSEIHDREKKSGRLVLCYMA